VPDQRLFSGPCERNRDPILAVLREVLPTTGTVLEIAAGTGMHAAWFSAHLPGLTWVPTDPDPESVHSIEAWRAHSGGPGMQPPQRLDVLDTRWPIDTADAVFNANMIHISPWEVTLGLLDGAARVLRPGAPLVVYGPYRRSGVETAPSNERFDGWLKEQDPRWGLRDLETVVGEAEVRGLTHQTTIEMPANNLIIVYRRAHDGTPDATAERP
jgi:SAM-dependent methyltransferase